MLQDRGALPKEEGDIVREYKATREEHFSSSWLREGVEGIEERRMDREEMVRLEESRSGNREAERVVVKRRCVNLFPEVFFEEFGPMDDSGSFGDSWDDVRGDSCSFSECVPALSSGVPVVTDVFVSLPSVGVLGEVFPSASDCEAVEPQSSSFSRKRQAFHVESQGDMNSASSPEDVQPLSERSTQEVDGGVDQRWTAVCQAVARRMPSYLDNSEALKVDTEELEDHVLAPSEPSVDIEHTARQARGEQRQRLFQIFSRQRAKEILVASVARWEVHLRMLTVLERECLDLSEAIGQLSEKQELLATLMESKVSLQKVAPENVLKNSKS